MSGTHAHTVEDRHEQATDPDKAATEAPKIRRVRPIRARTLAIGGALVIAAITGGWWIATL